MNPVTAMAAQQVHQVIIGAGGRETVQYLAREDAIEVSNLEPFLSERGIERIVISQPSYGRWQALAFRGDERAMFTSSSAVGAYDGMIDMLIDVLRRGAAR